MPEFTVNDAPQTFSLHRCPDPRPRYTHGIEAEGRLLFIAGQVAVDAENNVVGHGDGENKRNRSSRTSRPC